MYLSTPSDALESRSYVSTIMLLTTFGLAGCGDSELVSATRYARLDTRTELVLGALEKGATDRDKENALSWAFRMDHMDAGAILLNHGAKPDASQLPWVATVRLYEAINQGDATAVRSSIEGGADINAEREFEDKVSDKYSAVVIHCHTPLHRAVFKGTYEIVEMLLTSGAPIRADKSYGRTPLHTAVEEGHIDIVSLLIAKGADVNARTIRDQLTPLHIAAVTAPSDAGKYGPIVEQLVAAGADVNAAATIELGDHPPIVTRSDTRVIVHWRSYKGHNVTPTIAARSYDNSRIAEILETHGGR
ncbi:MAG: ankyrin repeat domain-containing protein [Sedimentisphaerales bacterium]|nr:ankyrin repeat domain-containing protein [Sedimentisphaerales bacterium]